MKILCQDLNRGPRVWTAPLEKLASGLFVLAALFITAAVAALAGIEASRLVSARLVLASVSWLVHSGFVLAALTCGLILLRVSTRRMLSGTFTGTLFHSLISLSIVCHDCFPLKYLTVQNGSV